MNFKKLRKVLLVMGVATCLALPMAACGKDNGGGAGGGTNVENTPTKLGAVVLSVDDNGLATWDAVENASKYEYTLDGGATYLETTECAVQLEEGQTIKVRAVGDGVNTRHGNWSEELSFGESSSGNEGGSGNENEGGGTEDGGEDDGGSEVTSLDAPVVTIDHTTGIASWEAVKGATEYEVSVDNSNTSQIIKVTTETSWRIPNDYGGLKVRAKNGNVESKWSVWKKWDKTQYNPDGGDESELEQLPTPNVQLVENKATWSHVEGATKYIYKIGEDGTETEENAPVEITLTEGQALYVKAVGDNETNKDSDWAISTTFTKTKLATPTLEINGPRVTWSETTNATGYVVEINGVEQPVQTAREYNLTDSATVRVKAVSTNTTLYSDSDWSNSETYTKPSIALGAVSATITNNMVKWDAVANASGYEYSFNDGLTVAGTTTGTTLSIDYNQSVVIRAKGDNVTYANGEWSTAVTNDTCYVLNNCDTTTGFAGGITFEANTNATYIKEGTASIKANGNTNSATWATIMLTVNGTPLTPGNLDSFGLSAIQFEVYNAESSPVNLFLSTRQAKQDNGPLSVGWNTVTISIATIKSEIEANPAQLDAFGNFYLQVVGNVYFDNVIGIIGTGDEGGSTTPTVTKTILNNCDAYNQESQIRFWVETNATTTLDATTKTEGAYSVKTVTADGNYINVYARDYTGEDALIPVSTLITYDYVCFDVYNEGTTDATLYYKDNATIAGTLKAGEWTTLKFDATSIQQWFGDGYCTFYVKGAYTLYFDNVCGCVENN